MDWHALAWVLAERSPRAALVLDGRGVVRLANRELLALLGATREEVIDHSWNAVANAAHPHAWVADALRGILRTVETTATNRAGQPMKLTMDLSIVGRGAAAAIFAEVVIVTGPLAASPIRDSPDVAYEIITDDGTFGTLVSLTVDGRALSTRPRSRCFEVIHQSESRCADCPLEGEGETAPRCESVDAGAAGSALYKLTTVERIRGGAIVRRRLMNDEELVAIETARMARLEERAGLSAREREVFKLLLLGRSTRQIGAELGIAERTVKHHKRSLQEKLGGRVGPSLLPVRR